jgi:pimeloyl-ACP methyl ester carboxylesterase
MSTPPFIAMPDGVAVLRPPQCPAPILLADPPGGVEARGDVLLVPGFTGSKEDFIATLAPLAERGWRAAAMDLPGQGGAPALGPRGSHSPATLAGAVLAAADWLAPGRPVHLVGHSMGGLVTREALLARPERIASWTPICSGPGPVPAQTHTRLLVLQAALASQPMEQVWQRKQADDRAAGWDPPSAEVAQFCEDRFLANDPAALADFAEILMTARDRTAEVTARLDERPMPVTVITGEGDDVWPVAQQEQMAHRLGVPWHLMAGVGHNPAAEAPEATVALLDTIFTMPPPDRRPPEESSGPA